MLVMSWLCRPLGASQGGREGSRLMKQLLTTLVILTGLIGSGGAVWADEYADDFYKGDAAVLGSTFPRSSVPRDATGTGPAGGASTSASVLPVRSRVSGGLFFSHFLFYPWGYGEFPRLIEMTQSIGANVWK